MVWTVEEIEYLKANYGKISAAQIAKVLGRSAGNVRLTASRRGLRSNLIGTPEIIAKRWMPEELEILKAEYAPDKGAIAQIAKRLSRTNASVKGKAWELGLPGKFVRREWHQEELTIVEKAKELPVNQIVAEVNALCGEKGWSKRWRTAIEGKLCQMGLSWQATKDAWYSVSDLLQFLSCSEKTILRWFQDKELVQILKPQYPPYRVHEKNLKAFFKLYPGEVAKTNPDVVWLVYILDA